MRKYPLLLQLLLLACLLSACRSYGQLSIVKLPAFTTIDSIKNEFGLTNWSSEEYLVRGDLSDTAEVRRQVERFARNEINNAPCPYSQCYMQFLKEVDFPRNKYARSDEDINRPGVKGYVGMFHYVWEDNALRDNSNYSYDSLFDPGYYSIYFDAVHPWEISVTGVVGNAKAGACVFSAVGFYYLQGIRDWDEKVAGKTIRVSGTLWVERQDPPKPGSPMVQGIFGIKKTILHPTWELVDTTIPKPAPPVDGAIVFRGLAVNEHGERIVVDTTRMQIYYAGGTALWDKKVVGKTVEVSGRVQLEKVEERTQPSDPGAKPVIGYKKTILEPKWVLVQK